MQYLPTVTPWKSSAMLLFQWSFSYLTCRVERAHVFFFWCKLIGNKRLIFIPPVPTCCFVAILVLTNNEIHAAKVKFPCTIFVSIVFIDEFSLVKFNSFGSYRLVNNVWRIVWLSLSTSKPCWVEVHSYHHTRLVVVFQMEQQSCTTVKMHCLPHRTTTDFSSFADIVLCSSPRKNTHIFFIDLRTRFNGHEWIL